MHVMSTFLEFMRIGGVYTKVSDNYARICWKLPGWRDREKFYTCRELARLIRGEIEPQQAVAVTAGKTASRQGG